MITNVILNMARIGKNIVVGSRVESSLGYINHLAFMRDDKVFGKKKERALEEQK